MGALCCAALLALKARPRLAGVAGGSIVASVRRATVCITRTALRGKLRGRGGGIDWEPLTHTRIHEYCNHAHNANHASSSLRQS